MPPAGLHCRVCVFRSTAHLPDGRQTARWAPNRACVEAMLRSAGLEPAGSPGPEIYTARRAGGRRPPDELSSIFASS